MKFTLRKMTTGLQIFLAGLLILSTAPSHVFADSVNPSPVAQVSFTFDDGLLSTLTQAAPTLDAYGLDGTNYVTTGCIGTSGICNADKNAKYMTWDQVRQLRDNYGWEIGAHSVNHYALPTLTYAEKEAELLSSKQVLATNGFDAKSFSTPYGDYDTETLAIAAKYYESHRGFWDQDVNVWPYNEYLVNVVQVQVGVSVNSVKAEIDQAIANKQWIVLVFHDILTGSERSTYSYHYYQKDLDAIAAYAKSKQDLGQLSVTKIGNSFVSSDKNLLVNSSFNSGIATGWRTDSPTSVQLDSDTNGSYPDATNSVRFSPSATNVHLFSPQVNVQFDTPYLVKSFVSIKQYITGELGFYIDEYDAAGNWVSGQWKTARNEVFVENVAFDYTPTSANVRTASLQVYATGGSGINAFVDNVQFFALNTETTPPEPPTPPSNLMPNGTFDNGVSQGWSTDSATQVTLNTANNGSPTNPQNAIRLTGTSRAIHLFSPEIAITSQTTYDITSYLRITQIITGEVGFYIDEYDATGNWVSGQWKTARYGLSNGDVSITYTPTSSGVASASLQIYATANSGITAYVDDIRWITRE